MIASPDVLLSASSSIKREVTSLSFMRVRMEVMFPRRMSPRFATLVKDGTNQLFTELATNHVTNLGPRIELLNRNRTRTASEDCSVLGKLLSVSGESSSELGSPILEGSQGAVGGGMGIGMGEAAWCGVEVLGGSPYERSDKRSAASSN